MDNSSLRKTLQVQFDLPVPQALHEDELHAWLSSAIEQMIAADFPKLVNMLYRLDVSEDRLKLLLRDQNGEKAAAIITRLIMEREKEKEESRERYTPPGPGPDGEERW